MRKLVMAILVLWASSMAIVHAESLQKRIDALGKEGGEIRLGCIRVEDPMITLKTDVAIVGAGACTIIPPVRAYGADNPRKKPGTHNPPIVRVRLENLWIDGRRGGRDSVGIDFRGVRHARINNVEIRNVAYGIRLNGSSINNRVNDSLINPSVTCYEIVDLGEQIDGRHDSDDYPNENTIDGGRCAYSGSPARGNGTTGVWIRNADNVRILNVDFENLDVGIRLDSGAVGTTILAPRLENMNVGIWLFKGAERTSVLSPYLSSVDYRNKNTHDVKLEPGADLKQLNFSGF